MYVPLKVMWDSVVIEPDLQKWGITHGIEFDGGGSAMHMARQLADCTVAALEIMQQHGVSLAPDGYTTNWGGSQGSMPTLYFDKWYDTEAPHPATTVFLHRRGSIHSTGGNEIYLSGCERFSFEACDGGGLSQSLYGGAVRRI